MQYTRFLCPPLSPRISSRLCPLSWWGYLTILSSAVPFSFCLQSFPVSGSSSVHVRWPKDGSFSFSISPSNECESASLQLCLTLCDPIDYTIHETHQARILEWVAISFSRASSQPRNQIQDSCIGGRFFTRWVIREDLPMNIQCWFSSEFTDLISLQSKGLSRVIPSTTIWRHQFFSTQPSLWFNPHICTWLLEKP